MPDILEQYKRNAVKAFNEEVGGLTGAGIKSFQEKPTWGSMIKGAVGGIGRRISVGMLDGSPKSQKNVFNYLQQRSKQWEGNPQDQKPYKEFAGMLDAISRKGYMNIPEFANPVKQLKLWQNIAGNQSGAVASKQLKKLEYMYDSYKAKGVGKRHQEKLRDSFKDVWIDVDDELDDNQKKQVNAWWKEMTGQTTAETRQAAPTGSTKQQPPAQEAPGMSRDKQDQAKDAITRHISGLSPENLKILLGYINNIKEESEASDPNHPAFIAFKAIENALREDEEFRKHIVDYINNQIKQQQTADKGTSNLKGAWRESLAEQFKRGAKARRRKLRT